MLEKQKNKVEDNLNLQKKGGILPPFFNLIVKQIFY